MERIRKKVTMVFQNGALFDSLSVGENVAFPLRERGDLQEQEIFQVVDGLLEAQRRRAHSRLQGLTEREHEVLGLMASGRNNAAIARDLVLSERAVEKHINSIFRKLGLAEQMDVNQRVAAVLFFLQRNV